MAVGFAQACINGFKSALAGLNAVKIDLVYLKSQYPILVSEKPVEVSSTSRGQRTASSRTTYNRSARLTVGCPRDFQPVLVLAVQID